MGNTAEVRKQAGEGGILNNAVRTERWFGDRVGKKHLENRRVNMKTE